MALAGAVAGAVIAAEISGAIMGIIYTVKKMDNDHEERMTDIRNRHDQVMLQLNNERKSEHEKHVELMKLFDIFYLLVSKLGDDIFTAEIDGCKGLPGFSIFIVSSTDLH